jgi:hypothetical protein
MMIKPWSRFLLCSAILGVSACGDGADPAGQREAASIGKVALALQATDAQGNVYLLPASAYLVLTDVTNPNHVEYFGIDDDAPVVSVSVMSGTYSAELADLADARGRVALRKPTSSGEVEVSARLLSENPTQITIGDGETTNLTVAFRLDKVGDVRFSVGNLALNATVDDDAPAADPTSLLADGLQLKVYHAAAYPLAGATLQGLPAFEGLTSNMHLELQRTGAWTLTGDGACAPVSVSALTNGVTNLVGVFLNEMSGAQGELCFQTDLRVTLRTRRDGAAHDERLRNELPQSTWVDYELDGSVPSPLLEDNVLQMSRLAEAMPLSNAFTIASLVRGDGENLAQVILSGDIALKAQL